MAGHHTYTRLSSPDSIRLISLEAGRGFDHISVKLFQCRIDSAPPYDALSYVWGDTEDLVTISCDSHPIDVTLNLHWALARIRHEHSPKFVWADAICINQTDIDERNAQVGMMSQIFSNARKVLLCMGGDPDGGAHDAADLVTGLSLLYRSGSIPFLQDGDPLRDDDRWSSFETLMDRPWFSRVWVIQEAGLAKDPRVLYGTAEFGYRELLRVLDWMKLQSWSTRFQIPGLLIHSRWSNWRHDDLQGRPDKLATTSFLELLSHGAMLSCSDPRDYVYAFLGHPLARRSDGKLLITPDYNKTPEEIYLEVSVLLISQVGVRMLSSVEHTEKTIAEDFPSWVARWNVVVAMNDISRFPLQYQAASTLSQPSSAGVGISSVYGQVLTMRGVIMDTLQHCYRLESSDDAGDMRFHDVTTGKVLVVSDIVTLLQDHPGVNDPDLAGLLLNTMSAGGWERAMHGKRLVGQNEHRMFQGDMETMCYGRSLIIGRNGYCGIASRISTPGDVCCVPFGADVPFILRPSPDGKTYRLLGEAYVHGLMHGRVVEMLDRKECVPEDLIIQ